MGTCFWKKLRDRVFKQPNELNMDWKSMKRGGTRMTVSVLLVSQHAYLFLFHCLWHRMWCHPVLGLGREPKCAQHEPDWEGLGQKFKEKHMIPRLLQYLIRYWVVGECWRIRAGKKSGMSFVEIQSSHFPLYVLCSSLKTFQSLFFLKDAVNFITILSIRTTCACSIDDRE